MNITCHSPFWWLSCWLSEVGFFIFFRSNCTTFKPTWTKPSSFGQVRLQVTILPRAFLRPKGWWNQKRITSKAHGLSEILDDPRESQVTFMARGCWDVPPKIYDVNARKTSEGPSRANMFHLFAWHILASMKLVHPLRKDPDRPLSSPMKLQQISGK